MKSMPPRQTEPPTGRQGLTLAIRVALRDLGAQLALLNLRVGDKLDLRAGDLQCLELVERLGPVSPARLARQTAIHPATLTGVIDRLERGGWVMRDRDPADRRSVVIRVVRDRRSEVSRHYAGMQGRLTDICAGLDEEELAAVAGFLRSAVKAGRDATDELAGD
jgi:DNA-binding MarR family transcriptional regulator